MPKICLCLTGKTIQENLDTLEGYRSRIDLAELRADMLDDTELFHARAFPERAGLPCILTVRRKSDGGSFTEGEGVRLVAIAKALAYAQADRLANFAYVDLESDFHVSSVEEACRTFGTKIIRSKHCMNGLPEDMDAAWASLSAAPDEIPKLAARLRGAEDLARLARWTANLPPADHIVIGMGLYGFASRALPMRFGSCISMTSALEAGLAAAAEGHIDPRVLDRDYRSRELGRDSSVYVLGGGASVVSSRSPALHNGAFRAALVDAVLVPLPAENIGALMAAMDALGTRGAAITVPYKEAVLPYLMTRSAEVEATGACNTLVREIEGWAGYNTDVAGFERSLLDFMGRKDLRGLRATIVGSGGAAKSAAYVLSKLGATALILNRGLPKAKALARRYGFAAGPCDDRSLDIIADHADLIVQATPMGMEDGIPGDPLDWYDFSGREMVFDLIYRPERTRLLERAALAGCTTTNGWAMLRYQAAAQFSLWTGRETPSVYFRQAYE